MKWACDYNFKGYKKQNEKTLYVSREENEETRKSKTTISTRMYLQHMIT